MGSTGPGEPGRVRPQPLWLPGRAEARAGSGVRVVRVGPVGLGTSPSSQEQPAEPQRPRQVEQFGCRPQEPDPGGGLGGRGGGRGARFSLAWARCPRARAQPL